jgi:hypothetical protein
MEARETVLPIFEIEAESRKKLGAAAGLAAGPLDERSQGDQEKSGHQRHGAQHVQDSYIAKRPIGEGLHHTEHIAAKERDDHHGDPAEAEAIAEISTDAGLVRLLRGRFLLHSGFSS